jgi:hypothetical protein
VTAPCARPTRGRRGWRKAQGGQGLVEFTLILPIVMMLMVSMLEFGRAFNDQLEIGYASREGARAGAALGNGGVTSCSGGDDPAGVDASVIAAAQRILKAPGSDVVLSDIVSIKIFRATTSGAVDGGNVNIWTYSPGAGPDVDPGPGATKVDFVQRSAWWPACKRVNSGGSADSLGVTVTYDYRLTTPLGAILGIIGGAEGRKLRITETTIMSLNPTA